jgi:GTP cyclohydrolase I
MKKTNKQADIASNYKKIIKLIGEDFSREGLKKTPLRSAKALEFLTEGYSKNADTIIKQALFKENYNQMVVIKNIELYSLCEHHLLPFFGKAHIAYIPNGKIIGLSKVPRIVNVFSRRLQVQERLTEDISNCLEKNLKPQGVAVVIEASHLCMQMRGVEKQNSVTTTSSFSGVFLKEEKTRLEFMNLIQSKLS